MAQYARPTSDIAYGGWTDEGTVDNDGYLYTSLDETTSDDDDSYVLGSDGDTTAEVKLGSVTDPQSSSGHVLHVLFRSIGSGGPEKLDIDLVQGTTVIASVGNQSNRSGTYLDINYTLTGTEADSITDYTDLRIRLIVDTVGSGEEIRVTQAYLETPDAPGTFQQSHFRIRDDTYGLNVDNGWFAALDTNCEVDAETWVRARIEVEEIVGNSKTATLKLQYRKNSGSWTDLTYQARKSETANPAIYLTDSSQYNDGDTTSNLLAGSGKSFVAGTGEENNTLPSLTLNNEHTEYEFCFIIHTFYDGPGQNVDGDTFELRLVESDGTPLGGTYKIPVLTLNVPAGLIGGTMIETPHVIGPFVDGNNNLYTFIEPSETDNKFMTIKSTDGGDQWAEVDGSNRPSANDLECVSAVQDTTNKCLWIIEQGVGSDVVLHKFRTSDHATNPDTYEITDESVRSVTSVVEQGADLALLSDGRIRAVWCETGATYEEVWYNTRSSGGSWGTPAQLDTASADLCHPIMVRGASDMVHIFYMDTTNEDIYHRSLASDNTLSGRELVEGDANGGAIAYMSFTEAVYWDDSGSEKIMVVVHDSDEYLYSVVVTDDGSPETRKAASDNTAASNAGGSRQVVASLCVDPATDTAWLLYAQGTGTTGTNILKDSAANDGGWGTDTTELSSSNTDWIRARVLTISGSKYLAYITDLGSAGATGYTWLKKTAITGATVNFAATAAGATTTPSADLAVSIPFLAVAAGATTTPSAGLSVSIPFLAAAAGVTSTPNIVLSVSIPFLAAAVGASSTPDDAILTVTAPGDLSGLASWLWGGLTGAIVTGDKLFAATIAGSTTTPNNIVLSVSIPFLAMATGQTTTPDAGLSVSIPLQATAAGITTTPDAELILVKLLQAAAAATSTTPDVALAVQRGLLAAAAAVSSTPSAGLSVSIQLQAAAAGQTTTPDDAILSLAGQVEFLATIAAGTTTPAAALAVARGLLAVALASSSTPNATMAVIRGLLAAALAASSTPDDVELSIGGLVTFVAACAAASNTPDVGLAVLRSLAGQIQAAAGTSDAGLAVERALAAALAAGTSTPDAELVIDRALAASATANTLTPDALLSLARPLAAQILAASSTPDNVNLVLVVAVGLAIALITARAPGASATARAPGVSTSGRAPSLTVN